MAAEDEETTQAYDDLAAAIRAREPEAAARLREAVAGRRDQAGDHARWGRLCEAAGEAGLALTEYQLALRDDPEDVVALSRLATLYTPHLSSGCLPTQGGASGVEACGEGRHDWAQIPGRTMTPSSKRRLTRARAWSMVAPKIRFTGLTSKWEGDEPVGPGRFRRIFPAGKVRHFHLWGLIGC